MDHQLVVLRGRSAASAVKLADGVTTAGRQEDCQLRIKSSQVSRKHCEFFEKNGLLLVKDLGSSNGTFVNQQRIQGQRVVEPGDEISIGPISFRVERVGAVSAAPAASTGAKPGDTAITAGVAATQAVSDDEFEIEFDDEPSAVEMTAMAVPKPVPVLEPAAAPAPTPVGGGSLASSRKPAPSPKPAVELPIKTGKDELGDDAVADFLLDLKIDDDD